MFIFSHSTTFCFILMKDNETSLEPCYNPRVMVHVRDDHMQPTTLVCCFVTLESRKVNKNCLVVICSI